MCRDDARRRNPRNEHVATRVSMPQAARTSPCRPLAQRGMHVCALRHRLPSRCLLPAMPGERRESRYGAIWDAKRLATVSTAANLMSWRHRAAHSASHGMLAHRPHVVAMLVATRRLAGAGIALMSVLARRWHGFARHWRAADMTVASCVPCRPYGMCASCAFPGRGARRAPVTVECGSNRRRMCDARSDWRSACSMSSRSGAAGTRAFALRVICC